MRNPKFLGVYSSKAQRKVGTRPRLFFVWQFSDNDFAVQELDAAMLPKSSAVSVNKTAFTAGFRQEPSILAMPLTAPDVRQLPATSSPPKPADGGRIPQDSSRQLEKDMRGNFHKAISALSRPRDRQGALAALEQLIRIREGIVPSHKHMFRDFGVSLRKKNLLELALMSSNRVLELAPDDDHAHFNIARIYDLLGATGKAQAHLERAISLDAREGAYSKFLNYLRRRAGIIGGKR